MGEIKAGLAGTEVLPLHLLSSGKGFPSRKVREKREAAKHVESFGVGFWIRVRFPAPPPKHFQFTIADCQLNPPYHVIIDFRPGALNSRQTKRQSQIGNRP